MLYSNDRGTMRDIFFSAWRKRLDNAPLETMEQIIVDVLEMHPEYQPIVNNPDRNRDRDSFPEIGDTNPFFHMGMHLTVIEQLRMDSPKGIVGCFNNVRARVGEDHATQHLVMDVLATWLGEGPPHDERIYLERLKQIPGLSI